LATGENIEGNVIIHPSANVSKDAYLGPNVVIGEECVIEAGVKLKNCTVFKKG